MQFVESPPVEPWISYVHSFPYKLTPSLATGAVCTRAHVCVNTSAVGCEFNSVHACRCRYSEPVCCSAYCVPILPISLECVFSVPCKIGLSNMWHGNLSETDNIACGSQLIFAQTVMMTKCYHEVPKSHWIRDDKDNQNR